MYSKENSLGPIYLIESIPGLLASLVPGGRDHPVFEHIHRDGPRGKVGGGNTGREEEAFSFFLSCLLSL